MITTKNKISYFGFSSNRKSTFRIAQWGKKSVLLLLIKLKSTLNFRFILLTFGETTHFHMDDDRKIKSVATHKI